MHFQLTDALMHAESTTSTLTVVSDNPCKP